MTLGYKANGHRHRCICSAFRQHGPPDDAYEGTNKRTKKAMKNSKRTNAVTKPAQETNAARKSDLSDGSAATRTTKAKATSVTRSKAARAHIAEGTRLFALARRPTKAQFLKVYGPKGPAMAWARKAQAVSPAEVTRHILCFCSLRHERPLWFQTTGNTWLKRENCL
jgi:hypothetical protein